MSCKKVKLVVFCPVEFEEAVRLAMGRAGAGKIGNYSYCAFVTHGKGYFLPLEGADPFLGEPGKINEVSELRIETVCDISVLKTVICAIRQVHPYEEIPMDVFELLDPENLIPMS